MFDLPFPPATLRRQRFGCYNDKVPTALNRSTILV